MEIKNMQYWKRKNALPGIIHEGDKNLPDGRSLSAPLQANTKSGSAIADTLPSDRDLKPQKVTYSKGEPKTPTRKVGKAETKTVGGPKQPPRIKKEVSPEERKKFIKKISEKKDVTKPWTH